MFEFIKRKPSAPLATLLENTGGGAHKRVNENRELLELLQSKAPELLEANPWVIGWLQSNDEVFVSLAAMSKEFGLHERFAPGPTFPRPWPHISHREAFGEAQKIIRRAQCS